MVNDKSQHLMPQAADWERFWTLESSQKFSSASWSKKRIIQILQKYAASWPLGPRAAPPKAGWLNAVRGGDPKDRPLMADCRKALDAGCGSGFFSAYFCSCGMETTAVDYSEQSLAMTRKATGAKARTVKANLLKDALPQKLSGSFDIIFSDGLFEHFPLADQDSIMQNLISVLSKGGVIVTFVPNRLSPWELIRPFYMPGIKEVPFRTKGLIELNKRNGLRVQEAGGINTIPFRYSPDQLFGSIFGMLLYTVAQKLP